MRMITWAILIVLIAVGISAAFAQLANAGSPKVTLVPPRNEMPTGANYGSYILANTGTTPAHFRVRCVSLLEDEARSAEAVPCEKLLFSPRVFTVNPGQRQVVRFMVDGLPATNAPLRARLLFEAQEEGEYDFTPGDDRQAAIVMLVSFTSPIIWNE